LVEFSQPDALDVDDPSPISGEIFVDPSTLLTHDHTKVLRFLYDFPQIQFHNPSHSCYSHNNSQIKIHISKAVAMTKRREVTDAELKEWASQLPKSHPKYVAQEPKTPKAKAAPRTSLRQRSTPKSYNERYLVDATAGRSPLAPKRASVKKAQKAKKSVTKKPTPAKPATKTNKKPTKMPLTPKEREAQQNAAIAAEQFAAGKRDYVIFMGGGCGMGRNRKIRALYDELVEKANEEKREKAGKGKEKKFALACGLGPSKWVEV
jgi:hypothetical protein